MAAILISCENNQEEIQFTIGDDLVESAASIIMSDTFSVNMFTIQLDSIATSDAENLIIGNYSDNKLGDVECNSYFRFYLPSSNIIDEDHIYDSISLVIKSTGYYYGDTLTPITFDLYRLFEEIEVYDDSKLYNNSSFKTYLDPLGSKTYTLRPSLEENIEIPLSNSFGLELFNLIQNDDDRVSDNANFLNYLKGFKLTGTTAEKNTVYGFSSSDSLLELRMYTHKYGEEIIEYENSFQLNTGSTLFNHIETNKENTLLDTLISQRSKIPSNITDEEVYIQGGTGIMTRIEFPSLANILNYENIAILKAELILKPVNKTSDNNILPENLRFYLTDNINRFVGYYYTSSVEELIMGDLVLDDEIYNENIYYSFDISEFIISELSDNYFDPSESALLVTLDSPEFTTSIDRMVFGSAEHALYSSEVKIYFMKYDD